MPGLKTNEIEGTRAVLRYSRMSAYKVREVLDLIRGQDVARAAEILRFSERDAARVVAKLLDSAVANARNNDEMDPDELYVSTCYADEGATIKRWRPRARGRATRIRKRTCHVTVIVTRLPEDRLERVRAREAADLAVRRARRVAGQRQSEARRRRTGGAGEELAVDETLLEEPAVEEPAADEAAVEEAAQTEAVEAEVVEAEPASEAEATTEVAPHAQEAAPEPAPDDVTSAPKQEEGE